MKFVSPLLVAALMLSSCAHQPLPEQVSGTIPRVPDEPEREIAPAKREGLSDEQHQLIAAGLAVFAIYLGYKLLSSGDTSCGDCKADGVVERGDYGYQIYRLRKATVCPRCKGHGYY